MTVQKNGREVFNDSDINNPDIDGGTIDNATIAGGSITGITDLVVADGGTGASTLTDHGILLGSGPDPITPMTALGAGELVVGVAGADPHALAAGATTKILVGGGAADPVWTEATGTGAPVRATSPTLVTPALGTPASGTLTNCTTATASDNDADTTLANTAYAKSQDAVLAREPDQGVAMTAATSGSNGIAVADDDDIDYGTGNFFGVIPVLLADYTPSAEVVLEQKTDGTNGREFTLQTNGKLRVTINTTDYDSTVATGCTDNTKHVFGYSVTRETEAAAGSIIFVVDGVQLGDAVAITAGAPTTINNAVSQYVLGTSATRTAGTINGYISGNRALTAAEHLALYRNGIAFADKWGSQTQLIPAGTGNRNLDFSVDAADLAAFDTAYGWKANGITSTFAVSSGVLSIVCNSADNGIFYDIPLVAGKKYNLQVNITAITGSWGVYGAGPVLISSSITTTGLKNIEFTATDTRLRLYGANGATISINAGATNNALKELGATLALEPANIQPAPGQWLDSSSNKLHAMQPATGSSLTRYKKDFEYRWTNTWTASSAAQYVGGLNQAVLSADHFITDIITQATVTTDVENLELGDGSDADRFVTAFAPSATRTKQTIAAQNDGTNLKLVYTPAAEATMTVETIIRGFIWEP